MQLKLVIDNLRYNLAQGVPKNVLDQMNEDAAELISSGIAERAKLVTKMPQATLWDQERKDVGLSEILNRTDKTIVCFFRGVWCPYCNLELQFYQRLHSLIKERNGQLIAISPQLPVKDSSSAEKDLFDFQVFTDAGNRLANKLGLVFSLPEGQRALYQSFGFELPDINGDDSWSLPLPATYLVDFENNIRKSFINSDHSQRAEPIDFINAL